MGILTVNIGNSIICLGFFSEKGTLVFKSTLSSDVRLTADQYSLQFCDILKLYGTEPSRVEGTVVSSVVPSLTAPVADSIKRLSGRYPIVLGPGVKTGLNILIENPAELGSDIVAEAVAAVGKYEKPIIIVDIGTVTVLSAIDRKGDYLGCAICPGVDLSYDALAEKTALLPSIGPAPAGPLIGKNTVDSMNSGILYGTSAMIDGLVFQMEEQIGQSTVVVTGDYAGDIYPFCRHPVIYDENLLLEGLFRVYVKNTQRKGKQTI